MFSCYVKVAWPSGLRRWFKAPVSSGAWVRIPPLPHPFGDWIDARLMSIKLSNSVLVRVMCENALLTSAANMNRPGRAGKCIYNVSSNTHQQCFDCRYQWWFSGNWWADSLFCSFLCTTCMPRNVGVICTDFFCQKGLIMQLIVYILLKR